MNRTARSLLIACLIALPLLGRAQAEDAKPPVDPAPAPAPVVADEVIPTLDLNDATLEEAVAMIQQVQPKFKAVVFRDSGIPREFPKLSMKLKSVSVSQFLELLTSAYPMVECKNVEGPTGVVICMNVRETGIVTYAPAAVVRIHWLAPVVTFFSNDEDPAKQKEALNTILSLIKAALDATGGPAPTLSVHEATKVLIFKGTAEQEAIIESVIKTLSPDPAVLKAQEQQEERRQERLEKSGVEKLQAKLSQSSARIKQLDAEVKSLHEAIAMRDNQFREGAADSERIKVRLEITEVRANELQKQLAVQSDQARAEIKALQDSLQKKSAELQAAERDLARANATPPSKPEK